jgi:hypothetical protein
MTQDYISILETARKVFVYANENNWDGLNQEVFADKVTVDDSSYPGAPQAMVLTSAKLVEKWKEVFIQIPYTRHTLSNELVQIEGDKAMVHAYVTGLHAKPLTDAPSGKWIVYSTYDIGLRKVAVGWRVTHLKQHYHFQEGHPTLVLKAKA